jgi:hypothetical protein
MTATISDDAMSWLMDHHLGDLEHALVSAGFLTLQSILSISNEYLPIKLKKRQI